MGVGWRGRVATVGPDAGRDHPRNALTQSRSDLIIVGGYGLGPVLEVVLASTVDELLRGSRRPVLSGQ